MSYELPEFTVPLQIVSPADVTRLRREIAALNDFMRQNELRGQPGARLPRTSRLMEELTIANKLDLASLETRKNLDAFLADLLARAPVIHISFSTDPSSAFMDKIVQWFRTSIHPSILIRVGLQPNIAVGCVVRTTNQYFDLSLKENFKKHRGELMQRLEAVQDS